MESSSFLFVQTRPAHLGFDGFLLQAEIWSRSAEDFPEHVPWSWLVDLELWFGFVSCMGSPGITQVQFYHRRQNIRPPNLLIFWNDYDICSRWSIVPPKTSLFLWNSHNQVGKAFGINRILVRMPCSVCWALNVLNPVRSRTAVRRLKSALVLWPQLLTKSLRKPFTDRR